jgi:hypothetical protein
MALPGALLRSLVCIVGEPHVLTGDATAGFAVDWTGRFAGHTPAVVRPGDTAEVAAVLALCTGAGVPVVPQGVTPAWAAAYPCTMASAGAHWRGTGAVRQDPFGARSVRQAEPERPPALIRPGFHRRRGAMRSAP